MIYVFFQTKLVPIKPLTSSRTLDSLTEFQLAKINTPSMSSSGYESQAVSTTNLTSDDSISIKSISVDETPDLEFKYLIDTKKHDRLGTLLVEQPDQECYNNVNNKFDNEIAQESRSEKSYEELHPHCKSSDKIISPSELEEPNNCENNKFESQSSDKKLLFELNDRKKTEMDFCQISDSGNDRLFETNLASRTKFAAGKV